MCNANTRTVINRGYELVYSNSNDRFTKDIFEKYGVPVLGVGAICNSCLTKLASNRSYLVQALFSPLMEGKIY